MRQRNADTMNKLLQLTESEEVLLKHSQRQGPWNRMTSTFTSERQADFKGETASATQVMHAH